MATLRFCTIRVTALLFAGALLILGCQPAERGSMKASFMHTLAHLDSTLITLQNLQEGDADYGALWCPHCGVYHTRTAEALYPLAYLGKEKGSGEHTGAAILLGDWLIRQQMPDGSWKETPEEWTGTTTDQLLMLCLAYPLLESLLTPEQAGLWKEAMIKAGNYLVEVMSPSFASINYCATTAASLASLNGLLPDPAYRTRAAELAREVVGRMDEDLFITGEGGRVEGIKYGVDLIYNLEMSLWGLAVYALLAEDQEVMEQVRRSAERHLAFIYPDGSMDGSWGIRSNKWTTYGGVTSDGSQVLFSILASWDPVYRTAALRNLEYLHTCMQNGWVGYGPQHWQVMHSDPCIYPTFARAKNLAMAHQFCVTDEGDMPPLPSERMGARYFPTLDLVTASTRGFTTTITAYTYKDPKGAESKYMFRPAGGAVSNLWMKGLGHFQAGSQTEYHRWEPMHFPEVDSIVSLTPRIEFNRSSILYTNLFEFDADLVASGSRRKPVVTVTGELKERNQHSSGIGYVLRYRMGKDYIEKSIRLQHGPSSGPFRIVEPVIIQNGTRFMKNNETQVMIRSGGKRVLFDLREGDAVLSLGKDHQYFWSPFPALKAFPIMLTVEPEMGQEASEITFRYQIVE